MVVPHCNHPVKNNEIQQKKRKKAKALSIFCKSIFICLTKKSTRTDSSDTGRAELSRTNHSTTTSKHRNHRNIFLEFSFNTFECRFSQTLFMFSKHHSTTTKQPPSTRKLFCFQNRTGLENFNARNAKKDRPAQCTRPTTYGPLQQQPPTRKSPLQASGRLQCGTTTDHPRNTYAKIAYVFRHGFLECKIGNASPTDLIATERTKIRQALVPEKRRPTKRATFFVKNAQMCNLLSKSDDTANDTDQHLGEHAIKKVDFLTEKSIETEQRINALRQKFMHT